MNSFKLTADPEIVVRDDGVECRTNLPLYQNWLASGGVPLPFDYLIYYNEKIDRKAEEVRKRYLTSCPLQGATYISKEADARAYKAAGYPTPFNEFTYQYVWAEMVANGDATAQIAADRIIYEADLYNNGTALVKGKGPLIEKERRAAKVAIAAAADKTALDAALAAGLSALDAL